MTRQEAIKWIETFRGRYGLPELEEAIDMAINALKIDEQYELEYEQPEPSDKV